MAIKTFNLPDPGEGLVEAEIVEWKVSPGDTVKVNDMVLEIETAKSLVELPIPWAGTVKALLVEVGQTIDVGTPIISIDDGLGGDEAPAAAPSIPGEKAAPPRVPPRRSSSATAPRPAPRPVVRARAWLRRPGAAPGPDRDRADRGRRTGRRARGACPRAESAGSRRPRPRALPVAAPRRSRRCASSPRTSASTSRRSPRPGADGIITRDDVTNHARGAAVNGVAAQAGSRPQRPRPAAPRMPFGAGEREERTPIKGVRKMTAQAMVGSAFTAPHVTEWITIDVTKTMELVDRLKGSREFKDVKVTPLLVLARALVLAVKRNPGMNATWDEADQEIVQKNYVNLGIAAATPRGLIVPNIKDAHAMTMLELAQAIGQLTATAREGRTQPAEMSGGTMTITNVGVFGVDSGTPIINPGESAIVCFGAIRKQPWVVTDADGNDEIAIRHVTQLAVSFDHRLIDGELGSRFLSDLAAIMADPAQALVWG